MFGHRGIGRLVLMGGLLAACAAPGGPTPIVITTEGQASAEVAAADSMMWAGPVQYELAQDLPELGGPAPAYQAQGDAATQSDAQRVATALGINDEAVPAEWGSGWTVGPTDGSGASLTVNGGPLGEWWFGTNAVTAMVCVEPGVEDVPDPAVVSPERACAAEPVPAQNLPTDSDAREQAQLLMDSIGGWVGDDVRVSRDVYGVTVEFRTNLGGVATPYWGSVRYGANAALESASGYLGTFEEAGDYPRIGTAAAFELLQSGANVPWLAAFDVAVAESGSDDASGTGGGSSADPGAADADGATTAPVEDTAKPEPAPDPVSSEPDTDIPAPDDPVSSEPGTDTPVTVEPEPDVVIPAPVEPDPIVVTITGVIEGLWTLYAADGSIWLVPAYHFIAADGGEYPVAAIPADLIEVAEPRPMPMEPWIDPAQEPMVDPAR